MRFVRFSVLIVVLIATQSFASVTVNAAEPFTSDEVDTSGGVFAFSCSAWAQGAGETVVCYEPINMAHGDSVYVGIATTSDNDACWFGLRGYNYNERYGQVRLIYPGTEEYLYRNNLGGTYWFTLKMTCDGRWEGRAVGVEGYVAVRP